VGQGNRKSVLVADPDPSARGVLQAQLRQWKWDVACAEHVGQIWSQWQSPTDFDVVILDIHWPKLDGLQLLQNLVRFSPTAKIIVLTAHGSIERAVQAIKLGAADFLTKPLDCLHLERRLRSLLPPHDVAAATTTSPQHETQPAGERELILGESWVIRQVRDMIAAVAPTDAKILITGESGTGKELAARTIHLLSRRSGCPFVPVNTAALPATLAESVLFGHEKGSFTGAVETQKGWCEVADTGTLFLDEIGEMDMVLQAKLLRFLQDQSFQRVGSSRVITSDARIVAATNGQPDALIQLGKLRHDLYHRLNVVPIHLPPLRERREDIPLLAHIFVTRYAQQYGKPLQGFSPQALASLQAYDWPGNVRELENLIQRMVVLSRDTVLEEEQLPLHILTWRPAHPYPDHAICDGADHLHVARPIDQVEKKTILDALAQTEGNAVSAASLLGIGQATMYRKIKRYGIAIKKMRRAAESSADYTTEPRTTE
jgi:DNA-binding NtrC family response regulator